MDTGGASRDESLEIVDDCADGLRTTIRDLICELTRVSYLSRILSRHDESTRRYGGDGLSVRG